MLPVDPSPSAACTPTSQHPDRIKKSALFAQLAPEWNANVMPDVRERVLASRCKVVVLDDDPTGTQTVYGLPVLTDWSVAALQAEFASEMTAFYILTNSRSFP